MGVDKSRISNRRGYYCSYQFTLPIIYFRLLLIFKLAKYDLILQEPNL